MAEITTKIKMQHARFIEASTARATSLNLNICICLENDTTFQNIIAKDAEERP